MSVQRITGRYNALYARNEKLRTVLFERLNTWESEIDKIIGRSEISGPSDTTETNLLFQLREEFLYVQGFLEDV